MTPDTVTVSLKDLPKDRSYPIHVGEGLLPRAGAYIAPLLKRPKTLIVTDETVAMLYREVLENSLQHEGIATSTLILPAGEQSKSFANLTKLCDDLIEEEIERADIIIALGGGVIGDVTGFAAAILRRGCRFVQIPTTLLAQVDSSVGGKTAINSTRGKNLIGAFHQPDMVLADIDVLDTLGERHLRAGYAEIVKYGALGDAAFFAWLEENGAKLLAGDKALRQEAVIRSVSAKARIVEKDEREGGVRALLNLGHTFGHAFESVTGYSDALYHGEAVALGMLHAFDFSVANGMCKSEEAQRLRRHLSDTNFFTSRSNVPGLANATAEQLLEVMYQDKKVSDGKLTFILAKSIGHAYVAKDISPNSIVDFLNNHG